MGLHPYADRYAVHPTLPGTGVPRDQILREIEDAGLPHIMFLNKIDKANGSVRETLKVLQRASSVPLLLRQIPIL